MVSKRQGRLRPSVSRFTLGDFEVTTLLDGALKRDSLHPTFGQNQPIEKVRRLAAANRLPPDEFEHPFVPTLVDTGRELILFDTGNGAARRDVGCGRLRERLPQAGYGPEDVDVVVITHGHPDHINGLWEGGEPAFPNAEYIIGAREFAFWSKGENIPEARRATRELFLRLVAPLADRARFVEPGEEVASGVRAVDAFGHSAGQLAYRLESEGRQLLLWADVTNHYVVSLQAPDWHVAVDDDKEAAAATRRRILELVATDGMAVIGYHMPFPALGFVELAGSGYRWVPASYQFDL